MQPECLLIDECVDARIGRTLIERGHHVVYVSSLSMGAAAEEVLKLSCRQNALLITEDNDFGELIFSHKTPAIGVIFLRYHPWEISEIVLAVDKVLAQKAADLKGAFVVITPLKIRVRRF